MQHFETSGRCTTPCGDCHSNCEVPAGCIAQLPVRETAKLQMFAQYVKEFSVLKVDCCIDNILTSHNNQSERDKIMQEVEKILRAGGFSINHGFTLVKVQKQMQGQRELLSP